MNTNNPFRTHPASLPTPQNPPSHTSFSNIPGSNTEEDGAWHQEGGLPWRWMPCSAPFLDFQTCQAGASSYSTLPWPVTITRQGDEIHLPYRFPCFRKGCGHAHAQMHDRQPQEKNQLCPLEVGQLTLPSLLHSQGTGCSTALALRWQSKLHPTHWHWMDSSKILGILFKLWSLKY